MASEWTIVPAEKFCVLVTDGTHNSPKPHPEGKFLVTSRHITGGRVDLSSAYQISQEDFDEINKRSKVDRWDVLISMIGTVGETCLVKEDPKFAIKNIGLFKTHGEHYGKWIYYYLQTSFAKQLILERVRGTTQQYIPLGELRSLPIIVPSDKRDMFAITCILGALDDKIDLNRKINKTLEEMAQAVFKSWFVDFDPVRYKAAGQDPPGLAPHIADLFPDSFEDSELGEIPKGWQIRPIGELVRVVGGGTPSTKEQAFWGGEHAFCTPKDMSSLQSTVLLDTERRLTDLGLSKVSSGELPAGAVLLSSRAPIGYLAITEIPVIINQGIIAMICDQELPNVFILYWLHSNMDRIIAKANGSTFLEISKKNFRTILAIEPNKLVLDKFKHAVEPIYKQIVAGEKQSHTLAALRDTLLPKLISGEIRVKDAERIVGRCI